MDMAHAPRRSRDDWIRAALDALLDGGPRAVTIEGVAALLGATKGSGYWHFASRADLLGGAVEAYRRSRTEDLIADVERRGGDPAARLHRLFRAIFDARGRATEARVLLADEPVLAGVVAELAERRIDYVAGLVAESGIARAEARRRAELAYCTVLGHEVLMAASPASLGPEGGVDAPSRAERVCADLLAPG